MRILVAGASGAIGRRLVPMLVARKHHVTATTRTPAKLAELRALGADAIIVDGLDGAAVGQAVARSEPDVIVHQMTALAGMTDLRRFDHVFSATNHLRMQGTRNLVATAAAVGVKRIVAQSYAGWTHGGRGAPATEDEPFDAQPPRAQRRSLAAIRFLEDTVTAAQGVVLRYGSFYGPGASDALVELVCRRRLPVIGDGAGVWSWIHLDDAAAATVAAVESDRPGIYHIVDDEPSPVAEWLPDLADILGAPPPRRLPVWVGRILAGEVVVRLMTEGRGVSNAKARY